MVLCWRCARSIAHNLGLSYHFSDCKESDDLRDKYAHRRQLLSVEVPDRVNILLRLKETGVLGEKSRRISQSVDERLKI